MIKEYNISKITRPNNFYDLASDGIEFLDLSKTNITLIRSTAFDQSNLKKIILPNRLEIIDDSAFLDCESLTEIDIPNSVTTIGNAVFSSCGELVKVSLSKNLKSIGQRTFQNCMKLRRMTIPLSVTSIGVEAFYNCVKLILYCEAESQPSGWVNGWDYQNQVKYWGITDSNYTVLNNIEYININNECILSCYLGEDLTVSIPSNIDINNTQHSVKVIGEDSFTHCTSLIDVVIPNTVEKIGKTAFSSCNLKSIVIGSSVKSIEWGAFYGCLSLKDIVFTGTIAQWNQITFGNYWNDSVPATYVQCSDGQVQL